MAREKHIDIEFVDLLNAGSLIAEASAKKYLIEHGLEGCVDVTSSGILVSLPKRIRFNSLIRLLDEYLNLAVENNVINRNHLKILKEGKDINMIKGFLSDLRDSEQIRLTNVLKNRDLINCLDIERIESPEQTVQADYIQKENRKGIVLAMSNRTYNRTKQIYSRIEQERPAIVKLRYYLRLPYELQELPFVGNKSYKEAVSQIENASRSVLKKELG